MQRYCWNKLYLCYWINCYFLTIVIVYILQQCKTISGFYKLFRTNSFGALWYCSLKRLLGYILLQIKIQISIIFYERLSCHWRGLFGVWHCFLKKKISYIITFSWSIYPDTSRSVIMLSSQPWTPSRAVITTMFKAFGMTELGIKPTSSCTEADPTTTPVAF